MLGEGGSLLHMHEEIGFYYVVSLVSLSMYF